MEIELTDRQVEKLKEVREDSTEGGELPPISNQQAMKVLLDTYDAVEQGLYTKDYTANEELWDLVAEWKQDAEHAKEVWAFGEQDAFNKCINQIEELIQE